MGIRFACHVCAKQLNIKQELAGKRGVCPACSVKFRIPMQDAATSHPLAARGSTANGKEGPGPIASEEASEEAVEEASEEAVEEASGKSNDAMPAGEPGEQESRTPASPGVNAEPASGGADVDLDPISADPEATWYVRPPSGGQYGPASGDMLRGWIAEGRVSATSLLWRDGWPSWRAASEVLPGLGGSTEKEEDERPSIGQGSGAASMPPGAAVARQRPPASGADPTLETGLSGRKDVGVERRQRKGRRMLVVGILSLVTIVLLGVLIFIIARGG